MRIRTIKPEWLDDERLVLASSDARVLSIALILLADDYGRGRANPTVLSARVFPGLANPRESLAKALDTLVASGFVELYEVGGQSYFAIRNWAKHQKVDHPGKPQVPEKPADSRILANPRETLAKVSETLGTDQDQDQDQDQEGTIAHVRAHDPEPPRVEHGDVVALFARLRAEAHQAKHGRPGGTYRRGPRDWQPVEDLCAWASDQPEPTAALEDSLRGYLADEWAAGAGWPISAWAKDPGRYSGRFLAQEGTKKATEEEIRLQVALKGLRARYDAARGTDDHPRILQEIIATREMLRVCRQQMEGAA